MLKDKQTFLRSFEFFAKLSDSNLASISYQMKEHTYRRGQEVYREGIDPVDKIYLIKNGEFELSKKLIKPVENKLKLYFSNNS